MAKKWKKHAQKAQQSKKNRNWYWYKLRVLKTKLPLLDKSNSGSFMLDLNTNDNHRLSLLAEYKKTAKDLAELRDKPTSD
jgi:hypothetical protein